MTKKRVKIPEGIEAKILAANRHTCCICHVEHKAVQIHHIDGNRSNNDPSNLCVVCLDHHGQIESKSTMGKGYTAKELRIYKRDWERYCKLEDNKQNITINFFNLSDKVPQLKDPSILKPFFSGIVSGVSQASVVASIASAGTIVEKSTGGKTSSHDFTATILKGTDWPEEGV